MIRMGSGLELLCWMWFCCFLEFVKVNLLGWKSVWL